MGELENAISSALITTTGNFIDVADLPMHLQSSSARGMAMEDWKALSLQDVGNVHIQRVLHMC
ncbi:MAG TPA: hypothetical protein VOA64_16260 [Candidatus Dormibacteraeota bacterium]|nr:hypothetical protein [Candidatus Dormibacteraeota bacterium]